MTGPEAQRIDKWLWHARFVRTRTAAQELVQAGHVRVNREKVKAASRPVRAGDVLTVVIGRAVRVVRILGIAERRSAAADARLLYDDRSPPNPSAADRKSSE